MKSVVKFSIKQTVLLNVVFVILVVAGAFSIFTTPLENMPVVDMGNVFINTVYYGASADDVEQLVTVEIEKALDGLEDVEYIKSNSYRNFSSVDVKFLDDSDYRVRYDELRFRVLNIKDELPPDADEPTFMYLDTNVWLPVVIVNIKGDLSPTQPGKVCGRIANQPADDSRCSRCQNRGRIRYRIPCVFGYGKITSIRRYIPAGRRCHSLRQHQDSHRTFPGPVNGNICWMPAIA